VKTGKYHAYPEYIDSDVDWLEEVPEHWERKSLNYLIEHTVDNRGRTPPVMEVGIPMCEVSQVAGNGFYTSKNYQKFITQESYDQFVRSDVKENDVLFVTVGATFGKTCLVPPSPDFFIAQNVVGFRCKVNVDHKFFMFLLSSSVFKEAISATNKSSTIDNVKVSDLVKTKLAIPAYEEQKKIANFLDYETAKIDTLIEKQQQLIKLLKEKRQAVISHAVTKGLNPDTPMKDSGVEWLGEVPEGWKIWKLKHACNEIFLGLTTKVDYVDSDGVPLVRALNISGGILNLDFAREISVTQHKQLTKKRCATRGDVLLSKSGSIGTAAIVDIDDEFSIYESIFALRSIRKVLIPRYLLFFIQSSVAKAQYERDSVGMGVHHLNMPDIQDVRIPIPSVIEQNKVLKKLQDNIIKFDNLVTKAEYCITLMQERRTALISAAVTGKIDIRNWQPPEQNLTNEENFL
jgi:type I restriction enzyme, S subunit